MNDEKRKEIAKAIATMTNGNVWEKANDDGSIKIIRVYMQPKGYAQIDDDKVNTNYIPGAKFQAVKDWLVANEIANIRRA